MISTMEREFEESNTTGTTTVDAQDRGKVLRKRHEQDNLSMTTKSTSSSTSTALDFLSHEQKVRLAVGSSLASTRPGAAHHHDQRGDGVQPTPWRKTQKDMLAAAARRTHEHDRTNANDDAHHDTTRSMDAAAEPDSIDCLRRRMHNLQLESDKEDKELAQELQKNRARSRRWAAVCITTIVIVFGVAVGATAAMKGKEGQPDEEKNSEKKDSDNRLSLLEIQKCNSSLTIPQQERYDSFRMLMLNDKVIASTINTPFTSSSIALCWISQYDGFGMDPTVKPTSEVTQRFALASIYFHFAGTNETTLYASTALSDQNWLSNSHVCEWDFVECGDVNGAQNQVTSLSFEKASLTGRIPYEMGLLQNLIQLKIAPNEMSGEIPTSLWNLTNLEVISLQFKDMAGTVMSGFGNLSHLKFLHLEHALSGARPDIGGLSELTHLFLLNQGVGDPFPFPDLLSSTDLGE